MFSWEDIFRVLQWQCLDQICKWKHFGEDSGGVEVVEKEGVEVYGWLV